MILHLVTDRLRLAGASATDDGGRECLIRQVEYAIEAGIDVVQIRERDLDARRLCALVRDVVTRASGSKTRIIVNDRADVAIACSAAGVHLRADSLPASVVRAMAPGDFLIGRSVHSIVEAQAACEGADYLLAGTIWPTASKPADHRLLGLSGFSEIAAAVGLPVLAIGGVSLDRAPAVAAAGAAGIAGISLFWDPTRTGCRSVRLEALVAALRQVA